MANHPKVVFCTHDSPGSLGGPFTWIQRLIPALLMEGIECRVLALTHCGGTGPVVEGLRQHGIDVSVVDTQVRMEDQIRWLLTQVNRSPPHVLVCNFVVAALFAARWVREAGAATIGVLHSDDAYYRAIQDTFLFGQKAYCLTDVVSVSEKIYREVDQRRKANEFGNWQIPCGVEVPKPIERDVNRPFRVAYVGRLAEQQKRISLVTRALIATCREIPNTEAVIYGDGPERGVVEQILANEGHIASVRLVGPLPFHRVQPALLDCDAIVLLSDYEGLPIALLEGMACGCVGICRSMDSGIPQVIQNGQTGMLVSDKIDDFVAAVKYLQEDRRRATLIAGRGRELILEKFSHESSVQQWAELLRRKITEAKPHPFKIPYRIKLPNPRPELEGPLSRIPNESRLGRRLRKLRKLLGAVRRRLF